MRRSNRTLRFESSKEPTVARESLEKRWREHLVGEPRLATLVTAQGSAREPFHRWLPYRQGFAPGLVRLFFGEEGRRIGDAPSLDPFSGSGTTIVESARQRKRAIGVEAIPALSFLVQAKFARRWIELPKFSETEIWEEVASQLTEPLHRAALMIAQARRHTGSGTLNRSAAAVARTLSDVGSMMREDLRCPLAAVNESRHGDARTLEGIDDESIGGIVTSPPYLSRYDYARTNDSIEMVYEHWFGKFPNNIRDFQVRALPRGGGQTSESNVLHAAAAEAREILQASGQRNPARAISDYFEDMRMVLASAYRVLEHGAAAWFVVGGVRLKDVYVPTDLIFAEMAQEAGFAVEAIRVARELNPIRRKFGNIGHIAPRESLIALRKV